MGTRDSKRRNLAMVLQRAAGIALLAARIAAAGGQRIRVPQPKVLEREQA